MGSNPTFGSHPRIYKFGYEQSSDITFVIGMDEFQCHKEMLSSSSPYFKGMFSSGFKENDQSRLSLHEDVVAFKMFLDILYNGWKSIREELVCCQKKRSTCHKHCRNEMRPPYQPPPPCCSSSKLWLRCTTLLQLFDKLNILDKMISDFKDFLNEMTQGIGRPPCACGGIRLLIYMFCFMNESKELEEEIRHRMADAIPIIKEVQPDMRFDMYHLEWVLKQNPEFDELCSSIVQLCEKLSVSSVINTCKFGDEELSDVTFIIGGEKFFCHKMELFFPSSGEISPDTVHLDEDAAVFSQLMSILYNAKLDGWRAVVDCNKGRKKTTCLPCPVIPKFWKTFSSLIKLADSLGVRDHVVAFLDTCFMSNLRVAHRHPSCTCDGAKFIFAVIHGLNEYRNATFANRAVMRAFSVIKKLEPDLTFNLDTFEQLLRNL